MPDSARSRNRKGSDSDDHKYIKVSDPEHIAGVHEGAIKYLLFYPIPVYDLHILMISNENTVHKYTCKDMKKNLSQLKTLKNFIMRERSFERDSFKYIVDALEGLRDLEGIDLSLCTLGTNSLIRLGNSFIHLPKLKVVILDYCKLSEDGLNHLLIQAKDLNVYVSLSHSNID